MKTKQKAGTVLIALGLVLILAAALLIVKNSVESKKAAGISADIYVKAIETITEKDNAGTVFPGMEMPVEQIDSVSCVSLVEIPVLNLKLPVADDYSLDNLKKTPCRYAGSLYTGNLVICGHNYQGHFAGFSKLKKGDAIILTDMSGNVFRFSVDATDILGKYDTAEMTNGVWPLTLFTCDRSARNRITVRCVEAE